MFGLLRSALEGLGKQDRNPTAMAALGVVPDHSFPYVLKSDQKSRFWTWRGRLEQLRGSPDVSEVPFSADFAAAQPGQGQGARFSVAMNGACKASGDADWH